MSLDCRSSFGRDENGRARAPVRWHAPWNGLPQPLTGNQNQHQGVIPMLLSNLLKNLSLVGVLALPFACGGVEAGDNPPELENEDAFTSTSHYWIEGQHYTTKNIGTSTGRSCFLAGLGGAIGGAQYSTEQNGAGIYINDAGDYILYIDPLNTSGPYTNKLRVDARCVHSDDGRT